MSFPTQISNRNFLSPGGFRFTLAKYPKIAYYCQSANIPAISVGELTQPTPFRPIPFEGVLNYQTLSLRFLVDEDLTDAYSSNDFFNNNWHVLVTSGNNAGEARRVTDYTGSTGTLAVSKAWADDGSTLATFELTTLDPKHVLRAYNRARAIVWPWVGIVRDVETVVTGNRQSTYEVPSTIRRVNNIYFITRSFG